VLPPGEYKRHDLYGRHLLMVIKHADRDPESMKDSGSPPKSITLITLSVGHAPSPYLPIHSTFLAADLCTRRVLWPHQRLFGLEAQEEEEEYLFAN